MAARMIGVAPKITTLQHSSEALNHDTAVGILSRQRGSDIFIDVKS